MSFLSIATPFVALGIPVFPLTPKTKIPPAGLHFLEEATIDPAKVASWNDENPDYNVALLANGEFCFLEFDVAKGMSAAAAEMGHDIPLTRTQVSGKGFGHYIFRHTERSRALGNRSVNLPEGGYKDWEPRPVFTTTTNIDMTEDYHELPASDPMFPSLTSVESISSEAQAMFDDWKPRCPNVGRIKYNCKKVAILSASGNHESVISAECMTAAIKFMEWQVRLREMFQPGEAVNTQAEFRSMALKGLKAVGAEETFVSWKRVAHDRKWGDKYGDWIVKTGIEGLVDAGELVWQQTIKGTGENKKAVENKRKVLINPAFSGNVTGKEAVKRVVIVKGSGE